MLAHDEVHKAFIQGPIGKGQVFLVSEPEAMFRSWIHDGADSNDFKVGPSPFGAVIFHDANKITSGWRKIHGGGRWRGNLCMCVSFLKCMSNPGSVLSDSYLISLNHR